MISAQVKRRKLIRQYPEKLREVNKGFLPEAVAKVQGDAKLLINPVSGILRASISTRIRSDVGMVYSNVEYAPHVEYGTRPHVITAKNAKVLTDGKSFFGRTVNHPGTKAQPFLRPALLENKTKIMRMWRRWFRSVYGR